MKGNSTSCPTYRNVTFNSALLDLKEEIEDHAIVRVLPHAVMSESRKALLRPKRVTYGDFKRSCAAPCGFTELTKVVDLLLPGADQELLERAFDSTNFA